MIFNFISVSYSTLEHLQNLAVIKYDNKIKKHVQRNRHYCYTEDLSF